LVEHTAPHALQLFGSVCVFAQWPPQHVAVWQSLFSVQSFPVGHLFGQEPPQSTSDSVPFLTPSEHVAVTTIE